MSPETDAEAESEGESTYCIMCHGGAGAGVGGMVALAHAHASRLRNAGVPSSPDEGFGCSYAATSPKYLAQLNEAPQSLFVCGHAMHLGCWQRHLQTHKESQRLLLEDSLYPPDEASKRETFCPLCRAASNVVLPLVPEPPPAKPAGDGESDASAEPSAADRLSEAHEWLVQLGHDGKAGLSPLAITRQSASSASSAVVRLSEGSRGASPLYVSEGALAAAVGVSSGGLMTRRHAPALLAALQDLHALRSPARSTEDGIRLMVAGESSPDGLPTVLLPAMMANWRGVALAFESAAWEWEHMGGGLQFGTTSAATMHSLGAMLRALTLRPAVLLEALKASQAYAELQAEMQPAARTSMLTWQLGELIPRLLQGQVLEPEQARSLLIVRPECPTLLGCNLAEVAVVIALAMPPATERLAHRQIELLGVAALAKAVLRACWPAPAESMWTMPDAVQDAMQGTNSSSSATADVSDGRGDAAARDALGSAEEVGREAAALDELRARLAAAADIGVATDAPSGAELVRFVAAETRHFELVTALLLRAGGGDAGDTAYPVASASAVLRCPDVLTTAEAWAAGMAIAGMAIAAGMESQVAPAAQPEPLRLSLALPRSLPTLHLHRMPPDFATLTMQLHQRLCVACVKVPQVEPALCLICGALLCAGPSCKRIRQPMDSREGECTRHARGCGMGIGIFALVHQGITLLVDGTRSAFYPSLYLDAHGEEDHGLRRGKPLYLSAARQEAIHRLWLAQAVPREVARSRASASHAAIRLGLY